MTAQVTVVGSINMDLVVRVDRLAEPGETVSGSGLELRPGGKGANQAVAAAAMAASVRFVGAVGSDVYGPELAVELERRGVGMQGLRTVEGPSGVALVVVDARGQNTITVAPGANAALSSAVVAEAAAETLAGTDAALLQLEIPAEAVRAACRLAGDAGARTILNAAPLPERVSDEILALVAACDVLVVNQSEAAQLLAQVRGHRPDDWGAAADALRGLGPGAVVITLGADGAVAATDTGCFRQRGFTVDTVDGTGAGDNFCGALAVGLAELVPWPDALAAACAAGAIATTRLGAQAAVASRSEIAELLESQGSDHAS